MKDTWIIVQITLLNGKTGILYYRWYGISEAICTVIDCKRLNLTRSVTRWLTVCQVFSYVIHHFQTKQASRQV